MKKTVAVFLCFLIFSFCFTQTSHGLSAGCASLNVPTRLGDPSFRQICGAFCIAIAIYKLDAVEGKLKEDIIKEHGATLFSPEVRFDLQGIDKERKGWTRHYPVVIEGRQLIVRVFLTEEKIYQPKLPVLFEISVKDPVVTCQMLLSVNSIIESRKVEPLTSPLDLSSAGLSAATSL